MKIKAAIFDMDGTLLDSLWFWEMFWERIGREYLKREGFRPTAEDDRAIRTMTLYGAMEFIHNRYNIGKSADELAAFCDEALVDFYSEDAKLKDGVIEFLEHLKAQGTLMCIASATEAIRLKIVIDKFGLEKYFSHVLSCADFGVGKDVPDIYLAAAEKLGVGAEDAWVFEDSYIAIKTAKSIGMKAVGIYDKNNFSQDKIKATADYYIAEGETLKKLI